jgi:hypothetical protein
VRVAPDDAVVEVGTGRHDVLSRLRLRSRVDDDGVLFGDVDDLAMVFDRCALRPVRDRDDQPDQGRAMGL